MATIPIEVIVQDAESPVDPTPTPVGPTDPGDNTNITVPDTGAGVVDSNNSGINNSSAAISIVSIVIAVLAIGAVITLLVRRHYKHKKTSAEEVGMTRQEKRAMAATSTIAVLALTILLGQLVVAGIVSPIATNAATDDTVNDEAELDVDSKITIIATRTEDEDTVVATVKNTSTITVDKPFGYEVAISMANNSTNLYLDGDETSEYYLSPVEDSTLADNTWGYTLDEEEYNAVPLADNLAVIAKGTTPVADEDIDIYYGINVGKDLPAGTYTGELEYTLSDTGFPLSLRTMQDMTTDICSSVPTPEPFKADGTTIEDVVPTIMLKDARDNKIYRVAKLADGKCWMTQNLDLQKEDLVVASLDSTNTNNPAERFNLPDSQTSGTESWGRYNDETSVNTAHVYDIAASGNTYKYCILFRGYCAEYGDDIPEGELGNLYNWYTATAGTGTYSTGTGDSKEAAGSVCPLGWRLPDSGDNRTTIEYTNLLAIYGILANSTSSTYNSDDPAAIFKAPLFLVPAGFYDGNSGGVPVGTFGSLWSYLAKNEGDAMYFNFAANFMNPWANNDKVIGYSVRCLAE